MRQRLEANLIEGQVAQVLNSRELVINRGRRHGVATGMVFAVLDPAAEGITDPETGELLGSVYRPKVKVKAVDVHDRMSVARTYEHFGGSSGLMGPGSLTSLLYGSASEVQTLRSDDALWEPITEAESYVKNGDPVRQVEDG